MPIEQVAADRAGMGPGDVGQWADADPVERPVAVLQREQAHRVPVRPGAERVGAAVARGARGGGRAGGREA
ncbi:hypothetical protein ACFV29_44320 [Streptomyces sp. NPDC059690]|uniref:hypothetical protein n=1 Tax=Streptomyces sp. NPDC059690 TaxID=3346907 RepID=UPI003688BE6B